MCAVAVVRAANAAAGRDAAGTHVPKAANGGHRPNVIILLIDDLGRSDLGIDGSTFHETPRLDALARSGVRFTDFYSAHSVCSPTRAALMTGKTPQRLGITDWIAPGSGVALPAAEITLGEAFRAHGYQTAYVGKWHLGEADADHPTRHGFEWTRGVNRAGQPGSYYPPYRRPGTSGSVWDVPDYGNSRPGDYLTDLLTTSAIEFLRKRDPQRPFLLCLAHYAVHTPIQPPANLPQKYKDKRARFYGDSKTPMIPAPFNTASRARQDNSDYAAMVENLDANVGRIVDAIAELGLQDNTILVFTSDNGGLCTLPRDQIAPTCNLPWRGGKGWLYEGGIRVPTFISWPAQLRPGTNTTPAITTDLYPTLLELCGLPPQPTQHLDGRSLGKTLRGEPDSLLAERSLAWYYPHKHGSGHRPGAALRRGGWKLVHTFSQNRTELYDLGRDAGESHNLASEHPDQVHAMMSELEQWIAQTRQKAANDTPKSNATKPNPTVSLATE